MKIKFRKDIWKIKIFKLLIRIIYIFGGSWCFFLRWWIKCIFFLLKVILYIYVFIVKCLFWIIIIVYSYYYRISVC